MSIAESRQSFAVPIWPFAYGGPVSEGCLRSVPEHFCVNEALAFSPSGAGEHVFLQIRKRGENTEFVARQLAKFAGIRSRDIGFAGMKDRHALTTQWFSVWLPGKIELDWKNFGSTTVEILQIVRHARKLQRGSLRGNSFDIVISDLHGDELRIDAVLKEIKLHGMPNYFGEQRFGNDGRNLERAITLFSGGKLNREQRALSLSAARSFLFNQILALRVRQGAWNRLIPGDVLMIDGSRSRFLAESGDEEVRARVTAGTLHPTGSLWGSGESGLNGAAAATESDAIKAWDDLASGLIASGVEMDLRPLRVNVPDLSWSFSENSLRLQFSLTAGSYATALLREVIAYREGSSWKN